MSLTLVFVNCGAGLHEMTRLAVAKGEGTGSSYRNTVVFTA
jgi:hypothetical protein